MQTFQDLQEIYSNSKTIVFRAVRQADGRRVILKTLHDDHPDSKDIAQLQREFQIALLCEHDGVVRPLGIEYRETTPILVSEDFGGVSLADLLARNRISITAFFRIASLLTDALGAIHAAGIVHKDVNPGNILLNIQTGAVKITDFGIASTLNRETSTAGLLEGTLAYLSPEQTGRINCAIDYRSDYYSLGATFYEMLTGRPPFVQQDAIELIHSHIAVKPEPPSQIDERIPDELSEIVLKLLAKGAEDRYQSAFGLQADLAKCRNARRGQIALIDFKPGQDDVPGTFRVPQKLYGRESEVAALQSTCDRIADAGKVLCVVAGEPGAGKSLLVNELKNMLPEIRGELAAGKFDQFNRDIPYRAFVQAFRAVIQRYLTEPEAECARTRARLTEALGANAALLVELIPDLENLVETTASVPELPPAEADNRFQTVFRDFVRCLCGPDRPLAIFLDDMQWADRPSLQAVELLLRDGELTHFMLVVSYRSTEVDAAHPFARLLHRLSESNATEQFIDVVELHPENLSTNDILTLIRETLFIDATAATPLAKIVAEKTNGNPFFINEFLAALHERGFIFFDSRAGVWRHDLERIETAGITDNVVDLMTAKITDLPETAIRAVKLAACLGNRFDLISVAAADQMTVADAARALEPALAAGILVPLDGNYRYAALSDAREELNAEYKFLHDRVHQAAYDQLSPEERGKAHYEIGRRLLQKAGASDENLMDITNHINAGLDLVTPAHDDQISFAILNLKAARKSKAANAYEAAFNYARHALRLLPDEAWRSDYELCLEIHREATEVAYMSGEPREAETIAATALASARDTLDRTPFYILNMLFWFANNDAERALLGALLPAARELGVKLPPNPGQAKIVAELVRTKLVQGRRTADYLITQPELDDPHKRAAVTILSQALGLAFFARPNLFPIITFVLIRWAFQYGVSNTTSMFCASYAMILTGILNDVKGGAEYMRAGLEIEQRLPGPLRGRTEFINGYFIHHWSNPLAEGDELLLTAAQSALERGDLEGRAFALGARCVLVYLNGTHLERVAAEFAAATADARQYGQSQSLAFMLPLYELVRVLRDADAQGPAVFNFDSDIHGLIETNNGVAAFYAWLALATLRYINADYNGTRAALREAEKFRDRAIAAPSMPEYFLLDGLAMCALWNSSTARERRGYKKRIRGHLKLLKVWAEFAPQNRAHIFELLSAEYRRISGLKLQALQHYQRAMELAAANEFPQHETLAAALVSKFHATEMNDARAARAYQTHAIRTCERWGARGWAAILRKSDAIDSVSASSSTETSRSSGTPLQIDLQTVIKASQALSGEIFLDRLLKSLMRIAIENAGAQSALLFLIHNDTLKLEARGAAGGSDAAEPEHTESPAPEDLPLAIVDYVRRTGEYIILGDAARDERFSKAPYVLKHSPRSVLCLPVDRQGETLGFLYLENNLSTEAFTSDRLELLRIMAAQAAISLENARLASEETERQKIRKEMDLARDVQMSILPEFPDDETYEITAHMTPSEQVGGDYYDFERKQNQRWLAIGDVTGHGLNSGLVMLMAQTPFGTYLENTTAPDVAELFCAMNGILYKNIVHRTRQDLFMTCTVLCADSEGTVRHAGRHEKLLVYRARTENVEAIESDGVWLGMAPNIRHITEAAEFRLESGDCLLLFTDGVIECRDQNGNQFDLQRLQDILRDQLRSAPNAALTELRDRIVAACFEFMEDQRDDLTVLLLRRR